MMLGAFTFFGGFLLGLWVGGPKTPSYAPHVGETPTLGLLPPQNMPLSAAVQPHGGGVAQGLRSGAQSIGFGNIASGQAGYEAQSAVTGVRVSGVPSFLSPLVTATQYAVGQQLGYKAQQKVGQQLSQNPSSPQPQVAPPPIQQLPV